MRREWERHRDRERNKWTQMGKGEIGRERDIERKREKKESERKRETASQPERHRGVERDGNDLFITPWSCQRSLCVVTECQ